MMRRYETSLKGAAVGLLSPRRAKGEAGRVAEFWSWWAGNRGRVIAAAQADRGQDIARLLSRAVDRLDKDIGWGLGQGTRASRGNSS